MPSKVKPLTKAQFKCLDQADIVHERVDADGAGGEHEHEKGVGQQGVAAFLPLPARSNGRRRGHRWIHDRGNRGIVVTGAGKYWTGRDSGRRGGGDSPRAATLGPDPPH